MTAYWGEPTIHKCSRIKIGTLTRHDSVADPFYTRMIYFVGENGDCISFNVFGDNPIQIDTPNEN
jgi:hypothetical protein